MTNNELNQRLIEQFSSLERLCNQIYDDIHGVTRYIDDMKNYDYRAKYVVPKWENSYKMLKEVRHKRNNLSHGNILFSEYYTEIDDINFINEFISSIYNQTDPLAAYRNAIAPKPQPKIDSLAQKTIKQILIFENIDEDTYKTKHNKQEKNNTNSIILRVVIGTIVIIVLYIYSAYILFTR